MCKTLHGGLPDLKYVPRSIKHFCHDISRQTHDPCLLEVNRSYIGLVECKAEEIDCFYQNLRPSKQKLAFEKNPAGINTLNRILPCARRLE